MSGTNGESRMDRVERELDRLALRAADHDHILRQIEETQLLTAAAQLKLAEAHNALEFEMKELAAAQKVTEVKMSETTERLDALIRIADEWIHKRPPNGV